MTSNGETGGDEVETVVRRGLRNRARALATTAPTGGPTALVDGEIVRRRALTATIYFALASLGVLLGGRLTAAARSPRRAAADNLVRVLSNRTSVIRVGAAYLATAPEDADPDIVVERMRRHGDALVRALETGNPGRVRRLAARDMRETSGATKSGPSMQPLVSERTARDVRSRRILLFSRFGRERRGGFGHSRALITAAQRLDEDEEHGHQADAEDGCD